MRTVVVLLALVPIPAAASLDTQSKAFDTVARAFRAATSVEAHGQVTVVRLES